MECKTCLGNINIDCCPGEPEVYAIGSEGDSDGNEEYEEMEIEDVVEEKKRMLVKWIL